MSKSVQSPGQDAPDNDRPALQHLTEEQTDLVDELLSDGLDSRGEILDWMRKAALRSVGQLGDGWFIKCVRDPHTVSAFLGEPWGRTREADVSTAWLRDQRRHIVMKDVIPAFQRGAATFRWTASEFQEYDEDDDRPDADDVDADQQHPMMRPAVARMLENQENALNAALYGFDDPDEIRAWAEDVIEASYAEAGADVLLGAYFDPTVRSWMLGPNHGPDRFWRENWLAYRLLPAFNRADESLPSRAKEQPVDGGRDRHIPQ